jgi:heme exporter protein D
MMLKFLQMGGYAWYVWPSYALALLIVGANIIAARRDLRAAQREARLRLSRARTREHT